MVLAGMVSLFAAVWFLRSLIGRSVRMVSYYSDGRDIIRFAAPVAVLTAVGCIQGFLEPFVIKHFLSSADAAGYYIVCRFGYIPSYITGTVGFVLFPLLSHRYESGHDTQGYLRQAVLFTTVVGGVAAVLLWFCGGWLLSLRPQWAAHIAYAPLIGPIGLLVTAEALSGVMVTHEIACRRFAFLWVSVPMSLLTCCVLYGSFGWIGLRSIMPEAVWQWGQGSIPRSLTFAVWTMVVARGLTAVGLYSHVRRRMQGDAPS
jgi:O-antigen/teichoic acid export membrane protein